MTTVLSRILPEGPWPGFDTFDKLQYAVTKGNNLVKYLFTNTVLGKAQLHHATERKFLPSLPLPPLSQSIANVSKVARRVLSDGEYEKFETDCKDLPAQAYDLQAKLWLAMQIKEESWNETLWQMGAYNSNRAPLRESSHWLGFDRKSDGVADYSSFNHPECVRGGVLLGELFKYIEKLRHGQDEVDLVSRFKGLRIDASSCGNMFSVRLPGETMDTYEGNIGNSHIIVEVRGHHYVLSLVDDRGALRSSESICSELIAIKEDAKKRGEVSHPVSVLTTGKRDEWFHQREKLLTSDVNKASFQKVESALLIVHLEEEGVWETRAESALRAYNQRKGAWDDMTLNLRIQEGSAKKVSICGHGNLDATAGAPTVETIYKNEQTGKEAFDQSKVNSKAYEGLKPLDFEIKSEKCGFDLTSDIQALLEQGINTTLKAEELVYTTFTKEKCKKARLNPDSVIQQVFQLTWVKTFGCTNSHYGVESYEAISKRAFRKGRTEQAHPFTDESEEFVKAMRESEDLDTQVLTLKLAAKALTKQKKDVLLDQGKGHDRHLFSLYALSKYYGKEIPALETYIDKLFRYKLSTSQLPQEFGAGGAFLPTEKDGIGIFYPIADKDEMRFLVTSHLDQETVTSFMENLRGSLDQVNALLDHIITNGQDR